MKKGKGTPKGGGGMMSQTNIKQNEINTLEIRYDVATVLIRDRKRVADELLARYPLSKSAFNDAGEWGGFKKYNYPFLFNKNSSENPYYWKMNVSKTSKYDIRFTDKDGDALYYNNGVIKLDLP